MLFTDVVTVFNHYLDTNGTDAWHRSVIKGVQWSHKRLSSVVGTDVQTFGRLESLTFDFERDYGNPQYVNPKAFKELTSQEGFYTLDAENRLDVVVLGEVSTEISDTYKLRDLQKDYQYVGTVAEVSDNRNRACLKTIKAVLK